MSSVSTIREEKLNRLKESFQKGDLHSCIDEAIKLIKEYKSATAYNIYALCHKRLGNYPLTLKVYEELLSNNPTNTLFLANLGNVYNDIGKLDKAESVLKKCLLIDINNFNVSISLGNIFATKSRGDDALSVFEGLLKRYPNLTKTQLSDVHYRIAEISRTKGPAYYDKAIWHYNFSRNPLSSAHKLELVYRSKSQKEYLQEETKINGSGACNPLLAAIQKHASIRFCKPDENLFCREPMKYIHHYKLTSDDGFNDRLIDDLVEISENFDKSPQDLLDAGSQTAGNFLLADHPSTKIIKSIISNKIEEYRRYYSNSEEGFIQHWPKNLVLHGWIIKINTGGSLSSHMHKLGWLSGSIYLKLEKKPQTNQGNIVFDLHGADYPKDGAVFPSEEYNIEKGDLILFPSSIFHRTIPFEANNDRVTLAFDIKPIY